MKGKIDVSIIIPVFNGSKFLKKTIDSCLNQTLISKIEIIVIDDCSSDESEEIINDFKERVRFYKNNDNRGIIYSANRGLEIANGEFLMFLGHDDLIATDHVEKILGEFDKNTSFVFCESIVINARDEVIKNYSIANNISKMIKKPHYYLVKGNFINSCGLLLRKEYALKIGGFSREFRHYGEWDLWIKLAEFGNIKFSKKVKSFYRRHDTNITNTLFGNEMPKDLFQYLYNCKKLSFCTGNFTFKQSIYLKYLIMRFRLSFYKSQILISIVKNFKTKPILNN